MNATHMNSARPLEYDEFQLGIGGGLWLFPYETIYPTALEGRYGLSKTGRWDFGFRLEGFGSIVPEDLIGDWDARALTFLIPWILMLDGKIMLVDEEKHFISLSVQPGFSFPTIGENVATGVNISRRFAWFEPYTAYRINYLIMFSDNWDDRIPSEGSFTSDVFLGSRFRIVKAIYLVSEGGVSVAHTIGETSLHLNFGFQVICD